MTQYEINEITIVCTKKLSKKEASAYVKYATDKYSNRKIKKIEVIIDGEFVELHYTFADSMPFQRIRRITGYLTGDISTWNNAKVHELEDRVTHK